MYEVSTKISEAETFGWVILQSLNIPAEDNFTTAFLISNPLEAECIFRGRMGFAVTTVNNNMKQYVYLE